MRVSGVLVGVAALGLAAFDTQEARQTLDGQWQGWMLPTSLSVDAKAGTATYVEGGKRTSGPFKIEPLAGKSFQVEIGTLRLIVHVEAPQPDTISIARDGEKSATTLQRVK